MTSPGSANEAEEDDPSPPSALFVHASLPRFLFSRAPLPIQLRFHYFFPGSPSSTCGRRVSRAYRETLSLSLFFLFLDSLSLYSFRNQRDREFAEMARRTEISLSKDRRVRCYIASVDKKKGVRNILSMRLEDISFQRAICDWKIRE